MVLEHLFPETFLEKKLGYAFLIAAIYSTVGIIAARLLFGANSGIVSIIFTSLLLLPYLQKLFQKEEREEERERMVSLKHLASIKHFFRNSQAIRIYFAIFLGVYLTYMFYSFILPQLGFNTFDILKEQLFVDPSLRGRAFDIATFFSILANNWWVLLACFIIAILIGDGAIFFVAWNASSWGALFGYRALTAGWYAGVNPWGYLFLLFIITFPHVILEGGAYILASISGSIVSDEIIKKKNDVRNFIVYFIFGVIMIVFIRALLRYGLRITDPVVFSIVALFFILALVYVMMRLFKQPRLQKVFRNNYTLFVIAILIFIIGAIVETIVLNNSTVLNQVYSFSMLF